MSICGNLQIYHPKSWLSASLDTVKYLVKFKNSVMPSQDDNCRRDEATYVSKYEQKYQIASGAFASVFLIRNRCKKTRVLYAAKYLKVPQALADQEVEILVNLKNCQQVVSFVEVFHGKFYTILVTEYLSGGDLFERLSPREYQLTEDKCQLFVRQILQGIDYIHSKKIVHLDIKPFNILFSNKNSDFGLKLIDFGLARNLHDAKEVQLEKFQGTVEYMSPEMMNSKTASTRSDMWSVGVVTYMLLSGGKGPFYSGSRYRTMARVLNCQYDLTTEELSHVSHYAKDLVSKLLVMDPGKRLSARQCLEHPWLANDDILVDLLHELETEWMRGCLARRRWHRALNALKAMHTMKKLTFPDIVPDAEVVCRLTSGLNTRDTIAADNMAVPMDIAEYQETYENIRVVGSGTFGSVYVAQDREMEDVYVASKYMILETAKVVREAEMLRDLIQSAFIPQLVGVYQGPLHNILVTEYLAGGDLVTRCACHQYHLTERKCQIFIRQIVRGIQYIHSQNIIHLDLKPFNIMFANPDDDYNLRIIDFGLSERLPTGLDRMKMTMCGTLEFMSPEVMDCKFASPASDMWGVGSIAYILLSGGVSPFWGGNRYRTMARTLSCDFNFELPNFEKVSENAKDFISRLLVLNADDRFTANQCLSHPWLTDNRVYVDVLDALETAWMRSILARRRWQRWYNAITATRRMRRLSSGGFDSL